MNYGIISIGAITLGVLAGLFALVKKNVIVGVIGALLLLGGIIGVVLASNKSGTGAQKAPTSNSSSTTQMAGSSGTGTTPAVEQKPPAPPLPLCKTVTEAYKNELSVGRTGLPSDQWVADSAGNKIRSQPEYKKLFVTANDAFEGAKAAHARVKAEMLKAHPQAMFAINDVFANKLKTSQPKVAVAQGQPGAPLAFGQEVDVNCRMS